MGYQPRPSDGLTSYTGSGSTGDTEIAAGDILILTVTVTGAASGMTCSWGQSGGLGANPLAVHQVVVGSNQVLFYIVNNDLLSPITTNNVTFYARVFAAP